LRLGENPYSLTITLVDKNTPRTFEFSNSEFISMTELVEQLIKNGISVPSSKEQYSLEFYKRCHRGVYPYTPPHIQLIIESNDCNLFTFWNCLHNFFQQLIIHLDSSETLPKDPQFPLGIAARAAHDRVLDEINEFAKSIPHYKKITYEEFPSLFDENGVLKDPVEFKARLYHAGIEPSAMPLALPFVFAVYDLNSTAESREKLKQELEDEFKNLKAQVEAYTPTQIENNVKLSSAFRVIKHDVSRTDRHLLAFKSTEGPGLQMVTRLLESYCVFNPPIGYLQGMNDLFVPILLAFLPKWDDNGNPVSEDSQVIDHEQFLSTIFWCFDAMLRNTDHLDLLADVTKQCQIQANEVQKILTKVSPLAAIWMKKKELKDLLWCYSDFVLLFKRSFPDIWGVWLQLNCAPYPQKWLTYFVAAIVVQGFNRISSLEDVTITAMMDQFPRILEGLDLTLLGETALWLAEKVPPQNVKEKPEDKQFKMSGFKYFETPWTGPSETSLLYQHQSKSN